MIWMILFLIIVFIVRTIINRNSSKKTQFARTYQGYQKEKEKPIEVDIGISDSFNGRGVMPKKDIHDELNMLYRIKTELQKKEDEIIDTWLPKHAIHYVLGYGFIGLMISLALSFPIPYEVEKIEKRISILKEKLR